MAATLICPDLQVTQRRCSALVYSMQQVCTKQNFIAMAQHRIKKKYIKVYQNIPQQKYYKVQINIIKCNWLRYPQLSWDYAATQGAGLRFLFIYQTLPRLPPVRCTVLAVTMEMTIHQNRFNTYFKPTLKANCCYLSTKTTNSHTFYIFLEYSEPLYRLKLEHICWVSWKLIIFRPRPCARYV